MSSIEPTQTPAEVLEARANGAVSRAVHALRDLAKVKPSRDLSVAITNAETAQLWTWKALAEGRAKDACEGGK